MLPSLRPLFAAAAPRSLDPRACELLDALAEDGAGRRRSERARSATREALRAASDRFDTPDFEVISTSDLAIAYEVYDREAFDGLLSKLLSTHGGRPQLRFSRRLRSSGGQTRVRVFRAGLVHRVYEITLSLPILFGAFGDGVRPAIVTGLPCHDRLDVLLRVFEHELVHLFEYLVLDDSSCKRPPFRALAATLFGHTESTHRIDPPAKRAARASGFRPGDAVRFPHGGEQLAGVVNRITRRATVLVRDPRGVRYSNGERYRKYYVPLGLLERA